MRKFFVLLIMILMSSYCKAEGLQGLFGFSPRDKLTQKPTLTLGLASEKWLFSLGVIFNSEYSDDDFVDTPIPHTDYEDLGSQRIGNTIGFDISRQFRIDDSKFSVFSGGGLYFGTLSNLVKSNTTGWLWAQDKKSKMDAGVEIGFFYGESDQTQIGLSYHTIKGANFYLRVGNF